MAERITVSTEEMRNTIEVYKTNKAKQQTAYLQMSNAVRELDGAWDGIASEAFKSAFDALYRNLESSELHMEDAINELTKSAGIYEDVEESEVSAAIKGLESGISYSV